MKALQLFALTAATATAALNLHAQSQNEMVKVSIIHHDGTSLKHCDTTFSSNGVFKLEDYYRLKGIDPAQVQTVNVNNMNHMLPADHEVAVWMMDSAAEIEQMEFESEDEQGNVVIVKRVVGGDDTDSSKAGGKRIMIFERSETSDMELTPEDVQRQREMAERMQEEAIMWEEKAAKESGTAYKKVEVEKYVDADGNVEVKAWVNGEEVDPATLDIDMDTKHFVIETEDIEGDDNHKVIVVQKGEYLGNEEMLRMNEARMHEAEAHRAFTLALVSRIQADEAQKLNTVKKSANDVRDLQFAPNPAAGKFRLTFELPEGGATAIRIYNLEGKEVYAENLVNFSGRYDNEIDVSNLTPGMYVLNILRDGTRIAEKLIVQ